MQLAKKQHVSQILEIRMLDKGQQTYTACWTCPGQTVSPHLSNQCKCHWKKKNHSYSFFCLFKVKHVCIIVMNEWNYVEFVWCQQHAVQNETSCWEHCLESGVRVTCDVSYTSVRILVFLALSVLQLGPMYATHRQMSFRQTDIRQMSDVWPQTKA